MTSLYIQVLTSQKIAYCNWRVEGFSGDCVYQRDTDKCSTAMLDG